MFETVSRSTSSSSTDRLGGKDSSNRLEVGSIGKAHGLRGEVVVRLSTDRNERVAPAAVLEDSEGRELVVTNSRSNGTTWIVHFEGIDDRDDAESLRGSVLFAEPLEDASVIWIHDLIGRKLREVDGTPRGTVVAVQQNPASDLMVTDSGALCPLTFYVEHDDAEIVVETPPGLFELSEDP